MSWEGKEARPAQGCEWGSGRSAWPPVELVLVKNSKVRLGAGGWRAGSHQGRLGG